MGKSVAVVICSWNKRAYLVRCIESVMDEASAMSSESGMSSVSGGIRCDVYVVDNASSDGSAEAVRERFGPAVTLIENPENRGGSGGFNAGISAALEAPGYDFVHLLDNDALIERGAVGALVRFMEGNRNCGVAGSKIYLMARPHVIQEFGAFIDYAEASIRPHMRFYDEEAGGEAAIDAGGRTPIDAGGRTPIDAGGGAPGALEVDYVPACSMLVRAEVFRRVGFFDESFFLYWDDMDFAVRARRAGYKVFAVSDSRVRHNLGTSNKKNLLPTYYFWRNRIRFFLKYGGADSLDALASDIYTAVFTCRETGKLHTLSVLERAVRDGFANLGGPFLPGSTEADTPLDFTPDAPKPASHGEGGAPPHASVCRIEVGHAILDAKAEDAKPKRASDPQNVYIDPYGNAVPAARAVMLKAQYHAQKTAFVNALKETGRVR
jgi:hypothetical protein